VGECKELHNVFDVFCENGVIAVTENTVVPAGVDSKTVELDVVLDNVLTVLHLQVVDAIFSISGRVDGAELGAESADECGPIGQPFRGFFRF
jgi:hypothetical protein